MAQQVPSYHNPAMPILLFSIVENAQEPTNLPFISLDMLLTDFYT